MKAASIGLALTLVALGGPSATAMGHRNVSNRGGANITYGRDSSGVETEIASVRSSTSSELRPVVSRVGRPTAREAPLLLWIDHACGTTPLSRASVDLAYFHDDLTSCIATAEPVVADSAGRGRGRVDPTSLARRAMDRAIALAGRPDFGIAPSEIGLTGLDTFLWLQSAPTPIEATASAGGVSVTAQAAPMDYLWDFGDGADLLTHHPGRPWTRQRPGNIAHLYETRGTYKLEVTIVWSARWRTGSGPWRQLGFFTTSATAEYQVRQVQSRLVAD